MKGSGCGLILRNYSSIFLVGTEVLREKTAKEAYTVHIISQRQYFAARCISSVPVMSLVCMGHAFVFLQPAY
jgi:hypothetical protein